MTENRDLILEELILLRREVSELRREVKAIPRTPYYYYHTYPYGTFPTYPQVTYTLSASGSSPTVTSGYLTTQGNTEVPEGDTDGGG